MTQDRENWVAIEHGLPDHPKIVQVGALGGWAHVCAICYADRFRTNGFIPEIVAWRILHQDGYMDDASERLLRDLLEANLWEEVEGGFLIHDYLNHQRSADDIRDLRAIRAEAGRRGGIASGEARRSKTKQTRSKREAETEKELETTPLSPLARAPKQTRKRDELWDALVEELEEPATRSERGKRNDAVKQLRDVGATPDEIRLRSARYRQRWPQITFTDQALAKHWTELGKDEPPNGQPPRRRYGRGVTAEEVLERAGIDMKELTP